MSLVLKKEARTVRLRWNPISDRIMSARFNSRYAWLTVSLIYESTNDAKAAKRNEKTPRHDMLVTMWDNKGWQRAMRRQGIGTKRENVERLAEFCALNDLVIGGTVFKHRDIYKLTWNPPNCRDRNQIDYIISGGLCLTPERWDGRIPAVAIILYWQELSWNCAEQRGRKGEGWNDMTQWNSGTTKSKSSFVLKSETDSRHWPTTRTRVIKIIVSSLAGCSSRTYMMRVQKLSSEKVEGSSLTGLVPKHTGDWTREV